MTCFRISSSIDPKDYPFGSAVARRFWKIRVVKRIVNTWLLETDVDKAVSRDEIYCNLRRSRPLVSKMLYIVSMTVPPIGQRETIRDPFTI
jgi:hypothetical protein